MKDEAVYYIYIQECLEKILGACANGEIDFDSPGIAEDGILYNLQTMSDATKFIPETFKQQHPEISWRKIVNFRNVLAHQYLGVNLDVVRRIVQDELPKLKEIIDKEIRKRGIK